MRYLRPRFQEMKPYHSGYIQEGVILNANESPYPVPEELVENMKEKLPLLMANRYPDTDSLALIEAIAKVYGLKRENVTCGVGSDELIDCILSATLEEDDKVLMPYPSFSMYSQFTELNCGKLIKVPLKADFSYDVPALKKAIEEEQPKVTFLCNPNNPTGCVLEPAEIEELVSLAKGLVVVDEAYEEFASADLSVMDKVNDYPNLIVLKTFSKAYALAGSRTGYALGCKDMIDLIDTVKVPYNLNVFSQAVCTWAIQHRSYFLENAKKIMAEKDKVAEGLTALGFKPYPTEANFIWVKMPACYFEALHAKKVYIRKLMVSEEVYFRITLGTPEENEKLLQALKEVKEGQRL